MSTREYGYAEPESIEEAVALLAAHGDDARVMSGGTGLMLLLSQGFIEPSVLVALRPRGDLAPLAGIERSADGALEVGALTTIRQLERSPLVASLVPSLAEVAHRVASVRIRNQATVGGHLAHADPSQDLPPLLLALDATVDVTGPAGRRTIPMAEVALDVFETSLASDEIVTGVRIPVPAPGARIATRAFRPRTAEDYPTVSVAVRVEVDPGGRVGAARIALGAVASTAVRAGAAEDTLVGRTLGPDAIEDAVTAIDAVLDPVGDGRGSAEYKRAMGRVWVRRALLEVAAGDVGSAVA